MSLAMQTATRIPLGAGMDYRVFLTSRRREELRLNLRFVEGVDPHDGAGGTGRVQRAGLSDRLLPPCGAGIVLNAGLYQGGCSQR